MKRFLLLAALCLFSVPVQAGVLIELPHNGSVEILGPSGSLFFAYDVTTNFAPVPSYQSVGHQEGWGLYIDVSNSPEAILCNTNVGGPCGLPIRPIVMGYERTLSVTSSFRAFGGYGTDDPNAYTITAILPDGYSVAGSVPEPATWVMLLIGFALLAVYRPLNVRSAV